MCFKNNTLMIDPALLKLSLVAIDRSMDAFNHEFTEANVSTKLFAN